MELVKADREILEYLKSHGMATPQEVAFALRKYSIKYIRTRMSLLERSGFLKRIGRGVYTYAEREDRSDDRKN